MDHAPSDRYAHLGLDEILGAYRMMHPEPKNPDHLAELLGQHLTQGGWPGHIRRRYYDLAWHDGMASNSFLCLDNRSVDLRGCDEHQVLAELVRQGDTHRWSGAASTSQEPQFTVRPAKPETQAELDALIGHIEAHLRLQAATPTIDPQVSRPRPRM